MSCDSVTSFLLVGVLRQRKKEVKTERNQTSAGDKCAASASVSSEPVPVRLISKIFKPIKVPTKNIYFILRPYFVQNERVPHINNSPPPPPHKKDQQRHPGERAAQFGNLCYIHFPCCITNVTTK
jgi:hypothetical protein